MIPTAVDPTLRRSLRGLTLLGITLLSCSAAQAIPLLDTLHINEVSRPLGGRSASTSPVTAYYNPARLTRTDESFSFTYLAINQDLRIGLGERPQGYDVAPDVYRARVLVDGQAKGLSFRPYPTS